MMIILRYWKFALVAGLVITMAALGAYITYLKSNIDTLSAEKATLSTLLDVSQSSVKELQSAINDQNEALINLKLAAEKRLKDSQVELDTAKAMANTFKERAAAIGLKRPPEGVSDCKAADDLINEAIRDANQ